MVFKKINAILFPEEIEPEEPIDMNRTMELFPMTDSDDEIIPSSVADSDEEEQEIDMDRTMELFPMPDSDDEITRKWSKGFDREMLEEAQLPNEIVAHGMICSSAQSPSHSLRRTYMDCEYNDETVSKFVNGGGLLLAATVFACMSALFC